MRRLLLPLLLALALSAGWASAGSWLLPHVSWSGDNGHNERAGTAGDDVLRGLGGPDVLSGLGGDDELDGGDGPDKLNGGAGDDTLEGGGGGDQMNGGLGDDDLDGFIGSDVMHGGSGNDTFDGDQSDDRIYGDEGDDVLHGGTANDKLYGGPGNDKLYGDAGHDNLYGQEGNDILYINNGESPGKNVDCGDGVDTLVLTPENYINQESNKHTGNYENAYKTGRIRNCEHTIRQPVPVDPAKGVEWEAETWPDPTRVQVKGGDPTKPLKDRLNGGHGNERLYGYDGDDRIWGDQKPIRDKNDPWPPGWDEDRIRQQVDYIDAGPGNDLIYNGWGKTEIHAGLGNDHIKDAAGGVRMVFYGDEGDDWFTISGDNKGPAFIYGGDGDDTIRVKGGGKVTVYCGEGDDVVKIAPTARRPDFPDGTCETKKVTSK